MRKKFFVTLWLAIMLALFVAPTAWAEIVASGECGAQGDNVTWTLDDNGTLTISGQGAMADYDRGKAPWKDYDIDLLRDYNVENIVIDNGITSIGENCFFGCNYLKSVQLPNGLVNIGEWAFYSCDNLISINLPQGLSTIGNCAFGSCSNLQEIVIPGTVGVINQSVFADCKKLTNVTIQNGVKSIDGLAFSNCSSLSSIFIPISIIRIEGDPFSACTNLTDITVDTNNTEYSSNDGVLYSKEGAELLLCPEGKTQYTVPESVTTIGSYAFSGCTKLTSIDLPESLTHIDFAAFADCTKLASINLPDSVTDIRLDAFRNCASLTEIKLPDGIKIIDSSTFADCRNLKIVYIPISVTNIYGDAFANCVNLEKIIYAGNEIQWGQIKISSGNAELGSAEIVFQGDGSISKPDDNKPDDNKPDDNKPDDSTNKPEDNDNKPAQPTVPDNLSVTSQSGGLGSKITVQITGGHWLTVQVRRAGSIAITSIQAQGQGLVDVIFSAAAGSVIQIWETETEMTFTNGVPDNKILATAVKNV